MTLNFLNNNSFHFIFEMLFSVLAVKRITFDRLQMRRRSEYCQRFNKQFNLPGGRIYSFPDPNKPCELPKYNRTLDNEWGLSTLNFLRWANGHQNDAAIYNDEEIYEQMCHCALYLNYNAFDHWADRTGKCYKKGADKGCFSQLARMCNNAPMCMRTLYEDALPYVIGHRLYIAGSWTHVLFCGVGNYFTFRGFHNKSTKTVEYDIPFMAIPHPGPIDLREFVNDWSCGGCSNSTVEVLVNGTVVPMIRVNNTSGSLNWKPNMTGKYKYNSTYSVYIKCRNYDVEYYYEMYTTNCDENISDLDFDRMMGRKSYGVYWQFKVNYVVIGFTVFAVLSIVIAILVLNFGYCMKTKENTEEKSALKNTIV